MSGYRFISSATQQQNIKFYYDVLSPWAWYSFEVLHRYKPHWHLEIDLRPVLARGVIKDSDNISPVMVESQVKKKYFYDSLNRFSKYYNVPLKPIELLDRSKFEPGSVPTMRFLSSIQVVCPQYLEEASRSCWMLRYNKNKDMTSEDSLQQIATESGLNETDQKKVFAMAKKEGKELLIQNTAEAVDNFVFGVPTIILPTNSEEPELFFGADSLPMFAHHLNLPWMGPTPPTKC